MIPDSTHAVTTPVKGKSDWRHELATAVQDPAELLRLLELDRPDLLDAARRAAALFPLRAPHSYIQRMRKADPQDPLLLQVLPLGAELVNTPGFSADPVGDLQAVRAPGLLQKYHGRALLVTTGACAIHCRYCFRREFPYATAGFKPGYWQAILDELQADTSVRELILSGGDPLTFTNEKLQQLLDSLSAVRHLKRIRIHSRLPVVLPSRIDHDLLQVLQGTRFRIVNVIHANHPNELDGAVAAAVAGLASVGPVFNQSVLLKGVNDSADVLAQLSEALIDIGVIPYYLHLLDRVSGTQHFDINQQTAVELLQTVHARLPGYMVPRLVREIAGKPGKTVIPVN
jgi:EF-P beta-lysylation protein EpmB